MEGLAPGSAVFDLVDQRILGSHKGDQGLPRPGSGGYELPNRKLARRLAILPPIRDPVDDVPLDASLHLVDDYFVLVATQVLAPPPLAPAHATRMPGRFLLEQRHHQRQVILYVVPDKIGRAHV